MFRRSKWRVVFQYLSNCNILNKVCYESYANGAHLTASDLSYCARQQRICKASGKMSNLDNGTVKIPERHNF